MTLQKLKLGDNVRISQMKPPAHYQKVNPDSQDSKYYDIRKEADVYFPRLGSFEVYVDKILIFSKLKSNIWPKDEAIVEKILKMCEEKQEGKEISHHEFEE